MSPIVERKYGASAARLHGEVVTALARCTNELTADVLRRVIQEITCGRFHAPKILPKVRKRMLIETLISIPHDTAISRWQRDLVARIRHGSYVESDAS